MHLNNFILAHELELPLILSLILREESKDKFAGSRLLHSRCNLHLNDRAARTKPAILTRLRKFNHNCHLKPKGLILSPLQTPSYIKKVLASTGLATT